MGKGGKGEELVVRKRLKVFIGALPHDVRESEVGNHFAKYGHVIQVIVVPPKDGKAPYAFATYKFAADADCAVTEPQHFPGCQRPLNMGFAAPKGNDAKKRLEDEQNDDACKVFVGGITDQDAEDQVGDFFSQWGLVVLVYRDRQWAFVTFATKEAAMRLLDEGSVIYQRRRLDVKPSDSKNTMQPDERNELIKRAVARHFHKKTVAAAPPHASYPPQPQYHHPPPGQAHYPPPHGHAQGPPPGYPPAHYPPPDGGHYGAPQGAPPPGYSPAPTYPPPGQAPPPAGHYGAPPPGAAADPYGARPSAAAPPAGHYPPPQGGHYGAPPGHAPPDYQHGAPPPEAYARDPYGHPPPHGGAPQHAAPPGPGAPPDYYRDSRGGAPPPDGAGGYYRDAPPQDPYGRAPGGPPPPAYRPY